MKLDLGCGKNKREGFIGVDTMAFDGVDIVLNLAEKMQIANSFDPLLPHTVWKPWPWEKESVEEVHCSHFLEHLTNAERVHFYNELYRVMKTGAKCQLIVPHWSSGRAYGDPTHQWPPVVEFSLYYLDKAWRDMNAPHCGLTCDFHATWGYAPLPHPWQARSQEVQIFAINHYREVAQDLIATLMKR